MKTKRSRKPGRANEDLLVGVARTIGSTLETLAAKATGHSDAPGPRPRARKARAKSARKPGKRSS